MKQSIIAMLITAIVAVCGGTFGKEDSNVSNKPVIPTQEAGTEITSAFVPEVTTKETETTSEPTTSTPEATTKVPITSIPEVTTKVPGTTKPEIATKPEITTKVPVTTIPEVTTKIPETTTRISVTTVPETTSKEEINQNLSYARQVVELVNRERRKAGLNSLTIDTKIESAALIRAKEIQVSFSHTRPNGSSFSTVLTENGINYRGSGENIAWGQRSPEEVMNGWMNSPGHRANILNSRFTKIGVGYYVGSNGRKYWTQLFTY